VTGPLVAGSKLWIMDGLPGSSPVTGEFLYNGALLQGGSDFTLSDGTTYGIDYNLPGDPAGTPSQMLAHWADHDLNHLAQITAARRRLTGAGRRGGSA